MFHGGFIPFEQLPEEVQAQLKEQQETHELENADILHQLNDIFDKLDKDELKILRRLLEVCHGDESVAHHMIGRITEILRSQHHLCNCGKDHDAEVRKITEPIEVPQPQPELTIPSQIHEQEQQETYTEEDLKQLYERYHVYPDGNPKSKRVYCATEGCTNYWMSLEHRMNSQMGSGGCPLCANKTKWG